MHWFTTRALATVALTAFAASPALAQHRSAPRPSVHVEIVDQGQPAYTSNSLSLELRTTEPATATPLAYVPVVWETSDPMHAWVSQNGTVVFLRPGKVTVTARRGEATASKTYDVQGNPAARVTLAAAAHARTGQPVHLDATALDRQGHAVAGDRVNLGVMQPGASVDDRGNFVADQPGTYTVLAEVNGRATSRTIVVDGAAPVQQGSPSTTRVAVMEPHYTAYVGTSLPLAAEVTPSGASSARGGAMVQWSVDHDDRATISPDGVLTALAPGRVTVTARAGRITAQRTITIYPNPTARLTLSAFEQHHLRPGDTLRVSVDALAPGARTVRDAHVAYGVAEPGSREGVHATITDDGRFVATRPGVYTIFAAIGDKADQQTVLVESD